AVIAAATLITRRITQRRAVRPLSSSAPPMTSHLCCLAGGRSTRSCCLAGGRPTGSCCLTGDRPAGPGHTSVTLSACGAGKSHGLTGGPLTVYAHDKEPLHAPVDRGSPADGPSCPKGWAVAFSVQPPQVRPVLACGPFSVIKH